MDALAKHIRKRLKSKKSCVVSERDLDRVWPREGLSPENRKRRIKILAFARANKWEATIYDKANKAIDDAWRKMADGFPKLRHYPGSRNLPTRARD